MMSVEDVIAFVQEAQTLDVEDDLGDVLEHAFQVRNHAPQGRFQAGERLLQFRRGIEQLEQEGVVQVLRSERRGEQAPVLAAVGPMQFEVASHRMAAELSAPISLEPLPYQVARVVDPADADFVGRQVSAEVLTRTDGVQLALFSTPWRLQGFQRDNPDVKLSALVAAEG